MSTSLEQFEYFEYPPAWEAEYRATMTVREWKRGPYSGYRSPGTLIYFAQRALRALLQKEGFRSVTWLQLASVDKETKRRVREGEDWEPATPLPSRVNPNKVQEQLAKWDTMRRVMGRKKFEVLQQEIIRAKFRKHKGEPDLFSYDHDGNWFFAEAKKDDNLLDSQKQWFDLAENLPALGCRVFLCRLVREGKKPALVPQHTPRWDRMIAAKSAGRPLRARPVR